MTTELRDRRSLHIVGMWAATFAVAGCSDVTPLAVVTGRLVNVPVEVRSVAAFGGVELLAAAPIGDDGRFVIGVPPTLLLEVHFNAEDGRSHAMEEVYSVCSTEVTLDLGGVQATASEAHCSDPAEQCVLVDRLLRECLDDATDVCDDLHRQIIACHEAQQSACMPEREALDLCLAAMGPCELEATLLMECESMHDCTAFEERIEETCADPCADERSLHEMVCLQPTEPCEPTYLFFADGPRTMPGGCEPEVPPL